MDEVTNFTLETDARVEHADDGTKMFKLTVVPRDGEPYQVDVEPRAFNSRDRFENEVVTGFSTWFRGHKKALTDLRELVAAQESEVLEGTELMGLNEDADEFVTPSGTLNEDGWMDEPETVHVERGVDVERKWSLSPDDDLNKNDVDEVLRLLPEIRPTDRYLTVLGWFYAAPLEPRFLEEWTGEYPLLSITGDTGAGKTSTLSVLWRAFGMGDEPLNMDMSPFSQLASFSSSCGVPVWFDEYRPADVNPRRVDKFHDLCRKTTRGATDSRGNADRTTDTYRIKSPVVVSGEQQFQDAALRRRSVLVHFQTGVADEGTDTRRAYAQLVGESFEEEDGAVCYPEPSDLRAHAYEYYTWLLGQDADTVEELWRGANEDVKEVLERHNVGGLDGSERTALAVTLFGMRLYQCFAEERGVSVPIDADAVDDEVEDSLLHAATNATGGEGRRRSHLDDFVELVGYAAADGYLEEDEHYTLIRDGEVLRFNLSRAYPKVRQYHRDHDLTTSLFEVSEYRNRLKDAADNGYVETVSQNTPPINRAVGVYLEEAGEVVDIDSSMFGGGVDLPPQHDVPLNTLEEGDTTTVTVEVWDERDMESDNVAQVGTLEDATGRVDFVVWDNGDETPTLHPETTYRLEGVTVGTYDDALQVQIDDRTEVEEVARGTGWLTPEDAGDNERLIESPQLVVLEELRDDEGFGEDELVERVEERGVDEEDAEATVETLLTEGVILRNNGLRLA
ncbi:hypothetical protein EGH25_11065 [Haladaptatus sp. F3-133]|uniref:Uncharacterized protein n=1 Tax=Halorutilus salinus TaxID=2487751 RepID=A0A9Q4GIH8_9EURY|nr:hypothetical protein [Halorutilus salinus]MCX2819890.1 hypothetical protein [Halorutilus salinus]